MDSTFQNRVRRARETEIDHFHTAPDEKLDCGHQRCSVGLILETAVPIKRVHCNDTCIRDKARDFCAGSANKKRCDSRPMLSPRWEIGFLARPRDDLDVSTLQGFVIEVYCRVHNPYRRQFAALAG